MAPCFQKTLYYCRNRTWHYIRLVWLEETASFDVRTAPCGRVSTYLRQEPLFPDETRETALYRLVGNLKRAGYTDKPVAETYIDVQIFTPAWTGFAAAAPWFDALQSEIVYPMLDALEDTANGGYGNGIKTEPGCVTHYLWVVNADAFIHAMEAIMKKAPDTFRVVTQLRENTGGPVPAQWITEDTAPDDDLSFLNLNLTQGLVPSIQPMFESSLNAEPCRPDNVCGAWNRSDPDRVLGEKAAQLREGLLNRWGVGKGFWPPLGDTAPCETLHIEDPDEETAQLLIAAVEKRIIGQVYALDAAEGIFTSTPDRVCNRFMIDDTYWFDDGLEWIIYASHEGTLTFGGDALLADVRRIFQKQPELLNPWWRNP